MQADKQFSSDVLWHIAHSAYCTFKGVGFFLKFQTCVVFFLLNGSAATFCCYLCAEHLLILDCFEIWVYNFTAWKQIPEKGCVLSLLSENRNAFFCRTAAMSFAEMEGISEAEYISHYFTGFCLCCFIYLFIYFYFAVDWQLRFPNGRTRASVREEN